MNATLEPTLEECFVMGQQFVDEPTIVWRPKNVVPPITDAMGKHWKQPDPSRFVIDNTHALMSRADFEELGDYSYSQPSGVYPGKMWRKRYRNQPDWWLCWFGDHPDAAYCSNHYRRILIA